ncbi:hypothetical protein M0812_17066 [Anaeramoeba flamelloides]|uniref:Uncharacterized protein n=1 Tax=Anaeramoeba flamelloides TaxID=1746091 RepID=A0AAV7ZA92_9EUKA|nr:hypothetical protein M0812_17066 [Anaeramoeba flamelloides]
MNNSNQQNSKKNYLHTQSQNTTPEQPKKLCRTKTWRNHLLIPSKKAGRKASEQLLLSLTSLSNYGFNINSKNQAEETILICPPQQTINESFFDLVDPGFGQILDTEEEINNGINQQEPQTINYNEKENEKEIEIEMENENGNGNGMGNENKSGNDNEKGKEKEKEKKNEDLKQIKIENENENGQRKRNKKQKNLNTYKEMIEIEKGIETNKLKKKTFFFEKKSNN